MNTKYFPDPSPDGLPSQHPDRNLLTIELRRHPAYIPPTGQSRQDFLYINELEDEWFLVEYQRYKGGGTWWLCDQWEGLVMLFKDKEWI